MQQAIFKMQHVMSDSLGHASAVTGGTPERSAAGNRDMEGCNKIRRTWAGRRLWSWESLPRIFALALFFLRFKVFIEGGRKKKINKLEVFQLL